MITTVLRLAVALLAVVLVAGGCGGDDENGGEDTTPPLPGAEEEAALQEEIADLGPEEQVERVGEAWAEEFAEGDEAMCAYLHPDLAGPPACGDDATASLSGSAMLRESFAGVTVESVDLRGLDLRLQTAVAEFSNGQRLRLAPDSGGDWKVIEMPVP